MKLSKLPLAALALAGLASTSSAAIVVGDVIGFDFGTDAGSATNFNIDAAPGNQTFTDVINTSGTVLTGVDFTFSNTPANSGDGGDSNISSDYSSVFPNAAQNDAFFESNAGQWTLTFSGLDDSLSYDLTIGSYWAGGTAAQKENRNTGWEVDGVQLGTVADSLSDSYVNFTNLSTDGSGNLVISTYDLNANTISTLSALTLTAVAVPEPSSTALLGLGGLALILRRRK
ncbi:PEP-CTERM sorting domain-containing protein [Rubritalea spongiae]|uniref:PEP-CTERM sorting domain-containing protein n=1 Tax=Rubritalea spongiae TaxID=430797 RepID=A0ABW5E1B2_9BACT